MTKLEKHLSEYYAYHRDFKNRATHFFGVPLVALALFHFFAWFRFVGAESWFSFASLFFLGSVIHYLRIDVKIALLVVVLFGPLLALAEYLAQLSDGTSGLIFGVTLATGVVLQGLGHVFEGRRPALVDNFMQIFNAPLLITCELLFLVGVRKDLEATCRRFDAA